jgi:hypothetical protein
MQTLAPPKTLEQVRLEKCRTAAQKTIDWLTRSKGRDVLDFGDAKRAQDAHEFYDSMLRIAGARTRVKLVLQGSALELSLVA